MEGARNVDAALESVEPASFGINGINKAPEVPFENEEKRPIVENDVANDNVSARKESFDDSENADSKDFGIYRELDEELPPLPGEKIDDDDSRDESLHNTRSIPATFVTGGGANSSSTTDRGRSHVGETFHADLSPRNEAGVKISLSGRIRVNGDFNRTPLLISFDAIPAESAATTVLNVDNDFSSASSPNAVDQPLDESSAESALDPSSSLAERENDEAYDDSSNVEWPNESRERLTGQTNASEVAEMGSPNEKKFLDSERGSEKKKKKRKSRRKPSSDEKRSSTRIEKRLDGDNATPRTAVKRVFLTNERSRPASVHRWTDEANDKLDPHSTASPVHFPDILGSVLVNNSAGARENQADRAIGGFRCPIDATTTTTTIGRSTDSVRGMPANTSDETERCCPPPLDEDPRTRNATHRGCYKMSTVVRKLPLSDGTRSESQTSAVTVPSAIDETTTANDRNAAGGARPASVTKSRDGVTEVVTVRPTNGAPLRCECGDGIRARNAMAIARFMTRLLRIIAVQEAAPRRAGSIRIGEAMIHVKDVAVLNGASRGNVSGDGGEVVGERGHDVAGRMKTCDETSRQDPRLSSRSDSTIASSAETIASSPPTSPSAEALEDQGSSFEHLRTSTKRSFLFYELGRKSLSEDASRNNTSIDRTDSVKRDSSNVFLDDDESTGEKKKEEEKEEKKEDSTSRRKKSRLNGGSRMTTNGGSVVDRLEQREIAIAANSEKDRPDAPSFDVFLLGRTGAGTREEKSSRKSRRAAPRATVSSGRRVARMKSLDDGNARGDRRSPSGDRIGKRRAAARLLLIDRQHRKSREVSTATPETVVLFRRARRGKADRSRRDLPLLDLGGDSFEISADGASPLARGGLGSSDGADSSGRADATRRLALTSPRVAGGFPRGFSSRERIEERIANEQARCLSRQ